MIKIIKGDAPENLVIKGKEQTALDLETYYAEPDKYDSGKSKFEAKPSIYNSDAVRKKLVEIQNGKCCYCETKDVRSNSDVEHYRPKAAYSEILGSKSLYPGYFWLAYEWDNLFLACQVCNQIFKNDFFPIEDNATRAQINAFSIANELPILIHPSIDNPEEHISYRETTPYGLTERGTKTIEYLGFGRLDTSKIYSAKQKSRIKLLIEERDRFYNEKKIIFNVILVLQNKPVTPDIQAVLDDAREVLKQAQLPSAEWSLMIKEAVKNDFKEF